MSISTNQFDPFSGATYAGMVFRSNPAVFEMILVAGEQGQLPRVSEYVVVDCGNHCVVGQLSEVRVTEEDRTRMGKQPGRAVEVQPVASIEPIATISLGDGVLTPGVVRFPAMGAAAYIATPAVTKLMAENKAKSSGDKGTLLIHLGSLHDHLETRVSLTPEQLFGRHLAVIGSSGGGKSWSVARLIEETTQFHCKAILIDASGEFHTLNGRVKHVHVGDDPSPAIGSKQVAVPYFHLTERDLFAIFKPRGQSQAPKLREAMKSLKLARVAPELTLDGMVIKADRSKQEFQRAYAHHSDYVENALADFDIEKLAAQINNECINQQRTATEPLIWGSINANDQSLCVPLINRIQDIIHSPNLKPIFQPAKLPSLFREMVEFLVDDSARVLRVSLKYLSFEHNAREIVANALGRSLLQVARTEAFKKRPLVIFLDEAHQFLNHFVEEEDAQYQLDSFALIAKEGRKYAMTVCLATQRPCDIPEGVLSQMGTMIVHRLTNNNDRSIVERATGGLDTISAGSLPSLTPGEALLVGADFPVPLLLQVTPPSSRPDSQGPDYQTYWAVKNQEMRVRVHTAEMPLEMMVSKR